MGQAPIDGESEAPEWQAVFDLGWELGRFSAHEVHDLYARYSMDGGLSVYAGVNNLTDEKPDIGMTYYPVGAMGRFFFAGVTWVTGVTALARSRGT